MRIALVWPKSTFLIDPMVYPPLGLWHIASALEGAGHLTDFFDLGGDPTLVESIRGYDQVWVSGTSPQAQELKELSGGLRGTGQRLVVGGPHAMLFPESLVGGYDLVVKGEVTLENVQSVVDARPDGGVLELGASDMGWWLPPVRRWSQMYHAELQGRRCTTMMTSLGCPFHCAFCSSNALYGSVRFLPLDVVKADIEEIARLDFGAVQFYDDILPIKVDRTLTITRRLMERGLWWRCFMRSDLAVRRGRGFLGVLATHGLKEILVGVESGSDKIKANIHKGTISEQDTVLRGWCRELGISFKASIILGLPGETYETMQETWDWLMLNRPDRVDVNTLIPMKGTPLCDAPAAYDCRWTVDRPDEFFFKGRDAEVGCVVETAGLSSLDILGFRNSLLHALRAEGIPY